MGVKASRRGRIHPAPIGQTAYRAVFFFGSVLNTRLDEVAATRRFLMLALRAAAAL